MRLRYFLGLFAALLMTACSVDVDVVDDKSMSPCDVRIVWNVDQAAVVTGKVLYTRIGATTTESVDFTANYRHRDNGSFEATILLPKKVKSAVTVLVAGGSYPATIVMEDSERVIKVTI